MKRPTVFQLNLLMQFPRDGSYISRWRINNPSTHEVADSKHFERLILKGYITEHAIHGWMFRLTDEAIEYLNGVKIK